VGTTVEVSGSFTAEKSDPNPKEDMSTIPVSIDDLGGVATGAVRTEGMAASPPLFRDKMDEVPMAPTDGGGAGEEKSDDKGFIGMSSSNATLIEAWVPPDDKTGSKAPVDEEGPAGAVGCCCGACTIWISPARPFEISRPEPTRDDRRSHGSDRSDRSGSDLADPTLARVAECAP
jgi:hypothetical protein